MSTDPFAQAQQFVAGGLTAAKWPKVGFVFEGIVKGAAVKQQTDYDDNTPLVWDDGSPRMQLIIDVQGPVTGITWKTTQNVQHAVPNDDGMRAMYVKGNLQKAIAKALRAAGDAKLELGGHIRVERVADGVAQGKKNPPHDYSVTWTPASPTASADEFLAAPAKDASPAEDKPPF
jgi:hypothetical protein